MAASGGHISVDTSGVVRTPLGVIEQSSIAAARALLQEMSELPAGTARGALTEKYLRLVPQKVPVQTGAGWAPGWLETLTSPAEQTKLLDALEASVRYVETARAQVRESKGDPVPDDLFRYRVAALDKDDEDFKMVVARYEETVNRSAHEWARRLNVKNVFVLTDSRRASEITKRKKIGNVQRLWHGSSPANILSILQSGLRVPTRGGGIHITGRAFGDGIYLSRSSSKSLGYSAGYWERSHHAQAFMFLTRTAMGKEYRPTSVGNAVKLAQHEGATSVNAQPGIFRNHEAVVWDLDQIELAFLVEFG